MSGLSRKDQQDLRKVLTRQWGSFHMSNLLSHFKPFSGTSVWNKLPGWVVKHLLRGLLGEAPPEALWHRLIFFLGYLVTISFPIEFDVWVRLCTHFEAAKVMTFASVTEHCQSVEWHKNVFIFFDGAKKEEGIEKDSEKIQVSHLRKESGVGRNNTWKQYWCQNHLSGHLSAHVLRKKDLKVGRFTF
jgi:hypothetical protein